MISSYNTFVSSVFDERLAHWVSRLSNPPVLAIAGIIIGAYAAGATKESAFFWSAIYVLIAVLAPTVYVLWLVSSGKVTDFNINIREQRIKPLSVILINTGVAWLVLLFGSAPHLIVVLAGASFIQMALLVLITLRWKISGHSAASAGLVVLTWMLLDKVAIILTIIVPLVAWSRIRLGRHDLTETIAGALLGGIVMAVALFIARNGF